MRFASLRARGMGPFHAEIHVDLEAMVGKLIAITGENGAGKTFFLELLAAAIDRECKTRGSLADVATARDAFLNVNLVNGARHSIVHTVDYMSGKGESVVTDETGRPQTANGKVSEFDKWAARHLPPTSVLYASTFAYQGSGGFLDLKEGDRKAVILRVLGIERLEALAKGARERAAEAKQTCRTLDGRIQDARSRTADPDALAKNLAALKEERAQLEQKFHEARAEHERILAAEQVAKLARQEADAYLTRRAAMVAKLQKLTLERADLERRMGNNRNVLERGDAIRAAVVRAAELDALREKYAADVAAVRAEAVAAENDVHVSRKAVSDLEAEKVRLEARVARARAQLADREKVEEASSEIPKLQGEIAEFDVKVSALKVEIEKATDFRINAATVRLTELRGALSKIANYEIEQDGIPDAHRAGHALQQDDAAAKRAENTPVALKALKAQLSEVEQDLAWRRNDLGTAERLAARATEIANAAGELEAAENECGVVIAALAKADLECEEATKRAVAASSRRSLIDEGQAELAADRAALADLLKFAEPLAQAQARLDEISPTYARLGEELAALNAELESLGDMPEPPPVPDVTRARAVMDAADKDLRAVDGSIAVREVQLSEARVATERLTALEAELRAADADLADWTRLGEDLGRDGLQALEIDAAGPEVTTITNDLLHEAFGPRFTMRFDTVKRSADDKKDVEVFDISVIDAEEGREGAADTYSGGEKVILGEAISLALTTVYCRRTGAERPTIVRDESGAALSVGRAPQYISMLRRACALVNADKVLLVSHSPQVIDLCDARIEISNGHVNVKAA